MGRRSKCQQSGHRAARRGLPVWSQAVLILICVAGFAVASDVPSPSAIRTSQREAWARFHTAHVELANAIERGVTTAIATQVSLREIVQACATTDRSEALRDIAVSAALELDGREITTHAWRCDTAAAGERLFTAGSRREQALTRWRPSRPLTAPPKPATLNPLLVRRMDVRATRH